MSTIKFYVLATIIIISLSSCLKESIADAMLADKNKESQESIATLSYKINGNVVSVSVNDNDNWNGFFYRLSCEKSTGTYVLNALTSSGEFTFPFYTNNLTTQNYKYTAAGGDMFFVAYNGTNEYVHAPSDSMSLQIISYTNGRISGNFSGMLTPLITAGNPANVYGTPGSVLITGGTFKNVPVIN